MLHQRGAHPHFATQAETKPLAFTLKNIKTANHRCKGNVSRVQQFKKTQLLTF